MIGFVVWTMACIWALMRRVEKLEAEHRKQQRAHDRALWEGKR